VCRTDRKTDGRYCYISIVRCRSYCWRWIAVIVVYLSQPKYILLMQNLASKILCIFVTGSAYAPYALVCLRHCDDLGWPWTAAKSSIFGEFREISHISEATTAKRMNIDPYCQRQRWNPLNVLFNIVFLALLPHISSLGAFVHAVLSRATLALARLFYMHHAWCM